MKSRVSRARAKLTQILDLDEDGAMELTDCATMAVITSPGLPI